MLTYNNTPTKMFIQGGNMKDYSECIINIKEFIRRAEDCFNAKNPIGAYKHTMDAFNEVQELLDVALEESKDD